MKFYKMLSICITCKNRSKVKTDDGLELSLLPNNIESLSKILVDLGDSKYFEFVISDFKSSDLELSEWIDKKLNGINCKVINVTSPFSRGKGRNIAFRHSEGDVVFFLDADMLITKKDVIINGLNAVAGGFTYFPICYSFHTHKNKRIDGWNRTTGFGNMMVDRASFNKFGWWKEKYSWGGEDDEMFLKIARRMPILRDEPNGFFHQWHPKEQGANKKPSWVKRLWGAK